MSRAKILKNPGSISNGSKKNDSPFFDHERTIGVVLIYQSKNWIHPRTIHQLFTEKSNQNYNYERHALESFANCTFERPEGFRVPSLARKAIPQCGATIIKTIFEMIYAQYLRLQHVLHSDNFYTKQYKLYLLYINQY